jgi:hypothetical protein
MPALTTMMSSRPNRSTACATASWIAVGLYGQSLSAHGFDRFDGLCCLVCLGYPGQSDVGAILGQALDDRRADSPRPAENHRDFSQQFAIFTHDYLHY